MERLAKGTVVSRLERAERMLAAVRVGRPMVEELARAVTDLLLAARAGGLDADSIITTARADLRELFPRYVVRDGGGDFVADFPSLMDARVYAEMHDGHVAGEE
jgi:hypothetical protein